MIFFKCKEQKETDKLMKKLTKLILNSDNMKALVDQARKQMEFDELQTNRFNFPVIQDLVNSAINGVSIIARFSDGTILDIKPSINAEEALLKMEIERKRLQKEFY